MGNSAKADRSSGSATEGRSNPLPTVDIPRWASDLPLPKCAYVPGRTARPAEVGLAATNPADWQNCASYLQGIDLFNHGYYWEAHERWEAVWIAAGRQGPLANFIKGLIKLAAALVKARQGQPRGVVRHARRAAELFRAVTAEIPNPAVTMGLESNCLVQFADKLADAPEHVVDASDLPVIRLTDFIIQPTEHIATR